MADLRRHLLSAAVAVVFAAAPGRAEKFYPDDPLWREPPPLPVGTARERNISDAYDLFEKTFFPPGVDRAMPAGAVNTLGEVPDSAWFQNRHTLNRRMSLEALARGPARGNAPSEGPWKVISGKTGGATPGLMIEDSRGRRYLLKFDPPGNPNMTTAADVIGSRFFHALGYNAPENYIVRFPRDRLRVTPEAKFVDRYDRERRMRPRDVDELLADAPARNGGYRAMASLFISGEIIGPFLYHGTRRDDPNDIVPHEHRRDLRGLSVFAAWLNHYDTTSLNTLDAIVQEGGVRYIRHYLIDFGSTMGSSALGPRAPRSGYEYLYDFPFAAAQLFTLGLYTRPWQRQRYPDLPEIGRFTADFDPPRWRPIYLNPAFENRLPEDAYWAAKKVMAFTDADIRAIVATGEFDDAGSVEYLAKTLSARRDRIAAAFLDRVPPLENFRFENGRLEFDDLAVVFGLRKPRRYSVSWFRFDNSSGSRMEQVSGPLKDAFTCAEIRGEEPGKRVIVYFRPRREGGQVAGIERLH